MKEKNTTGILKNFTRERERERETKNKIFSLYFLFFARKSSTSLNISEYYCLRKQDLMLNFKGILCIILNLSNTKK